MVQRRIQKRIEAEAAEKSGKKTTKKKAAKKKTTRKKKTKAAERKKIFWGVFSGTLKEEGRYAYDEKDKAEERLEQLLARGKRTYFIQPIKVPLSETLEPEDELASDEEDDEEEVVKSEDEGDGDADGDSDGDWEEE